MHAFLARIDELNRCAPDERGALERSIHAEFEVTRAVLALDMSNYSLFVRRGGILPHLCKIRRMQLLATPIIEGNSGELIKQSADNLLALFDTPDRAIQAAVAINHAIEFAQATHGEEAILSVGIGIDFGQLLRIPQGDCFGDCVNIAYKLGEDLARAGEILITETALSRLQHAAGFALEALDLSISGMELSAHRVRYESSLPNVEPAALSRG